MACVVQGPDAPSRDLRAGSSADKVFHRYPVDRTKMLDSRGPGHRYPAQPRGAV